VAGDAAVGEEIGRVGEDEVDGGVGDLGEDFEAVALEDAEVVFGVVEGGSGEIGGRFGHDDRSGSLIRRVRVSRREEVASDETRRKDLTQSTQRAQRAQGGERAGTSDLTQRARRRRPNPPGVNEWRVTSGETRRKDLTQSAQRTQSSQRGERAGKAGFNTEGAEKTPWPGRGKRVTSGETRRKDLTQSTQRTQRAQRGKEEGEIRERKDGLG